MRVKQTVTTPRHGWGSVKHGHVGTVARVLDGGAKLVVDFPSQTSWTAQTSEMERCH